MDTSIKMQPAAVNADAPEVDVEHAAQNALKPDWRTPLITRIEIKRTKLSPGSNIDGFAGSKI